MKCPKCYFLNEDDRTTCAFCGADLPLDDSEEALQTLRKSRKSKQARRQIRQTMGGIRRWIANLFFFILYALVTVMCILIILFILVRQCVVNWPIAPEWDFLPNVVVNYWNWLDEWQMKRCPDLMPDNYFFGDEPVPIFDESGALTVESACGNAVITFNPQSAPAGTTMDISLDGFMPEETIEACWYYPSTKLENCIDLQTDADGQAETVYFSSSDYPRGTYRMEAEDSCALVSQDFILE